MKNILLMLCLGLTLCKLNAQSSSPSVVASSGSVFTNSSGSLSFTVAEMSMTETFSSTNNSLTQGFQQPSSGVITTIIPTGFPGLSIKIFPNPTTGKVYISITTVNAVNISGILYDATGRKVSGFDIHQASGQQNHECNWNNLNSGVYIMELLLKKQAANNYERVAEKIFITH